MDMLCLSGCVVAGLTDNSDGTYTCVVEAKQPSLVDYVTSASLSIMVSGVAVIGSFFRITYGIFFLL